MAEAGMVSVTGIDASQDAIAFATAHWGHTPGVNFQHASLAAFLPSLKAAFDGIVCFGLSEYVPDAGALLQGIAQSLKPGSLLIASFPNGSAQILDDPGHVRHFLEPDLRALFAEANGWDRVALLGQWPDGTIDWNLMAMQYLVIARRRQDARDAQCDDSWGAMLAKHIPFRVPTIQSLQGENPVIETR